MKNLIFTTLLVTLFIIVVSFSLSDKYNSASESNIHVVDSKKIDVNTISTWFTNNGDFNRDPVTSNAGFEWPRNTGKTARYASGPWIGARTGNDTLVAVAEYSYEYLPGYTDNNGNPQGHNDPLYRTYKIVFGQVGTDRDQWPNALINGNSDQGAPVYYDPLSHTYKALDYGHQTMFYRYTDSYPESHGTQAGSTAPLKVDIKQIDYAFNLSGSLGNVIFSQFTIINRRNAMWTGTYITLWSDDDLGYANDDMVGCDTTLNMGYTYNGVPIDPVYGSAPPAVAFLLLKGPSIYTGNNMDTSYYCNGQAKMKKVGYKTLGMTVFNWYQNGTDPHNYRETYNYMCGLHNNGAPIINPVTGHPTKFMFSGDPVSQTGWIQSLPDDQRFMMSMGPFDMNAGDTQIVVLAQVISQGTSNLNSISVLRQSAVEVMNIYKNCFGSISLGIENKQVTPYTFSLSQNYPNPFNPTTKIKFDIPSNGKRETANVKIIIYDVLGREVATLVNEQIKPGSYEIEWDGSNYPSGVYFYKLQTESFSETKKLILLK